jgi:hypothetical protein
MGQRLPQSPLPFNLPPHSGRAAAAAARSTALARRYSTGHQQSNENDAMLESFQILVDVETPPPPLSSSSVPCHVDDCQHLDDECSRTSCTTRSSSSSSSRSSRSDNEEIDEHDCCEYDSDSSAADERVPLHHKATSSSSSSSSASTTTTTASCSLVLGPLSRGGGGGGAAQCGKLLFGTVGIYIAYLSYGLIQEDLYRYKRIIAVVDGTDDSGDLTIIVFTSVWFLQVLESTASIVMGISHTTTTTTVAVLAVLGTAQ